MVSPRRSRPSPNIGAGERGRSPFAVASACGPRALIATTILLRVELRLDGEGRAVRRNSSKARAELGITPLSDDVTSSMTPSIRQGLRRRRMRPSRDRPTHRPEDRLFSVRTRERTARARHPRPRRLASESQAVHALRSIASLTRDRGAWTVSGVPGLERDGIPPTPFGEECCLRGEAAR